MPDETSRLSRSAICVFEAPIVMTRRLRDACLEPHQGYGSILPSLATAAFVNHGIDAIPLRWVLLVNLNGGTLLCLCLTWPLVLQVLCVVVLRCSVRDRDRRYALAILRWSDHVE